MQMTVNNQTNIKPEKFYLWWLDARLQRRLPAGVAFYDEKYAEYRLKIDFLQALISESQDGTQQFYLKPIGTQSDKCLYRAEAVIKKGGKFAGRFPVGEGYSSNETEGEVYIDFGPFEKTLVLSLNN